MAKKIKHITTKHRSILRWHAIQCTKYSVLLLITFMFYVRKKFLKKKFVTWYAEEIKKQMDAGVPAESIDVNLKLTSLKALHTNWLIELYNVLTTADGRETVLNGWKKSGVTAVLKKEEILPPKDPFSRG